MAELTIFRYASKRGRLHGIHPGIKMILLGAYSAFSLGAPPLFSMAMIPLSFLLALTAGTPLLRLLKGILFLAATLTSFCILGALSFSPGFSIDTRAFLNSVGFSSRVIEVYLFGETFFSSTSSDGIRDALLLFSRKVFRGKGPDLGLLVSLTVSFIPMAFMEYRTLEEARKSRGIDTRRRPLSSFLSLMLPLCIKMLGRADDVDQALRARGYERERTVLLQGISGRDITAFVLGLAPLAALSLFLAP